MNFQYKQVLTNLLMAKQFVNTIYKQSKNSLPIGKLFCAMYIGR
ncbi:hypothetical protein ACERC6_07565 [Moraxella sp. E33BD]